MTASSNMIHPSYLHSSNRYPSAMYIHSLNRSQRKSQSMSYTRNHHEESTNLHSARLVSPRSVSSSGHHFDRFDRVRNNSQNLSQCNSHQLPVNPMQTMLDAPSSTGIPSQPNHHIDAHPLAPITDGNESVYTKTTRSRTKQTEQSLDKVSVSNNMTIHQLF